MPEEVKGEVDFFESINQSILKKENLILIILLIISLAITIILATQVKVQWAQDSHWHMALAKNLYSGNGYTLDGSSPHGKYPPGLALLILPFMLITSNVQIAGMIMIAILSLLTIFLIFKVGKMISPLAGLVSAILLLTHNLFVFNSVSVMTEIPFAFFSIASIYFFVKAFDKKALFIPSLIFFAISCLIRYDGFLLVIPFAFFLWKNKPVLKEKIRKEFYLGVLLAILIIGAWFIRNWIVFHNPLYTEYSSEITAFSISQAFYFLKLYFKTGYVLPFLGIVGTYFLIKEKNQKMNVFYVWFLVYMLLHLFWSAKAFRFYVEILPLICLLAALGTIGIAKAFGKNKKAFLTLLAIITVIIIAEQSFIFLSGSLREESTIKQLNAYESIHQLAVYANKNLPDDAIYVVPDKGVYNTYLEKSNTLYYNEGLNYIFSSKENKTVYILADTIHSWMTKPFLAGENGQIVLQTRDNVGFLMNLIINTDMVDKEDYNNFTSAMILKVTSAKIERA